MPAIMPRLLPILLTLLTLLPAPGLRAEERWSLPLRQPWQVASGLLPGALAQRYATFRVSSLPKNEGLRWTFTPLEAEAELRAAGGMIPSAGAYSLVVRLAEGKPCTAALAGESWSGESLRGPGQKLSGPDWVTLSLPSLGLPLQRLALVVGGLGPKAKYAVDLQAVAVAAAPPAPPAIAEFTCPAQGQAGQPLICTVRPATAPAQPMTLRLRLAQGGRLLTCREVELAGTEAVQAALPTPVYLPEGDYEVSVEGPAGPLPGATQILRLSASGQTPEPLGTGDPGRLRIMDPPEDGTPIMPAEGHLFRLPVAPGSDPYGLAADCARAEKQYDYTALDEQLAALLNVDPQARVLLQVWLDSPPWWEAAHPTAVLPAPKTPPAMVAERKLTHASWCSAEWQAAAAAMLQSLVRHLEESPLRAHVVGYELCSGRAGAWRPWLQTAEGQDKTAGAQLAWRTWLQAKYQDTARLRGAWGQPVRPVENSPEVKQGLFLMQWAQVKVPALAPFLDRAEPALYDPSGHQERADYQQFLGEQTAGVIAALARAGREVSGPMKLWGACYGHLLWWQRGEWPPPLAGHLGLGQLLAGTAVDFLTGPPGADLFPTTALASVRLHGKFYLEQPADGAGPLQPGEGAIVGPGPVAPPAQATPAQAALVVDEESLSYLSPATGLAAASLSGQLRELRSAGISPEVWLLGDLPAAPLGPRLYVMAAAYQVPAPLRAALRERFSRAGQVALWLYAPGVVRGFLDSAGASDLTGFKLTLLTKPGPLQVKVLPGDPTFTPDLVTDLTYGVAEAVQPRLVLVSGAESAGTLAGTPWSGLGLLRTEGTTMAFSAAPGVPAAILANLLKLAER